MLWVGPLWVLGVACRCALCVVQCVVRCALCVCVTSSRLHRNSPYMCNGQREPSLYPLEIHRMALHPRCLCSPAPCCDFLSCCAPSDRWGLCVVVEPSLRRLVPDPISPLRPNLLILPRSPCAVTVTVVDASIKRAFGPLESAVYLLR